MDEMENKGLKLCLRLLSYVLVAALASAVTLFFFGGSSGQTVDLTAKKDKLEELKDVILEQYIGEADEGYMMDMAATGMVAGTGDRWSYYIPAADMQAHNDQRNNSYVGIGVTIRVTEDGNGFEVLQVEPNGPAKIGGILPGDIIVAVDGQSVAQLGVDEAADMVSGPEHTGVQITVTRDGQELTFSLIRKRILVTVASGRMVTETVGYI